MTDDVIDRVFNMQPKGKSILLADDDRTILTVIANMLADEDYRVDQADRGEKCLFMALEKTYDALSRIKFYRTG